MLKPGDDPMSPRLGTSQGRRIKSRPYGIMMVMLPGTKDAREGAWEGAN